MAKKAVENLKSEFQEALKPAVNQQGKIDLESLKNTNAPLHDVLREYAAAKTFRDDPEATASDLAKLVTARDASSGLGQSLAKLEQQMKDKLDKPST